MSSTAIAVEGAIIVVAVGVAVILYPSLHHFLAQNYAQGRRFQEALRHEERALYPALQQGNPVLVKKIKETLALYRRLAKTVP